jgi:hypothetical protein
LEWSVVVQLLHHSRRSQLRRLVDSLTDLLRFGHAIYNRSSSSLGFTAL